MKKLTVIIGICLIACITQAQTTSTSEPSSTPATPTRGHSKSVKSKDY